jgi:protein gp37
MGQEKYHNGFKVTLHPELLNKPFEWKRPKRIFVNSMSDLFHEKVPKEFVIEVFKIMSKAKQHQFQVLTKRSDRLAKLAPHLPWPGNIWMGVTVENKDYLHRIEHLLQAPAAIRFISFEPLLGPVSGFDPDGIDWVVVGGESGPNARPIKKRWAREIRDTCVGNGVPFFFKQWGGCFKKKNRRQLDGRFWNQYPKLRSGGGLHLLP